jgi:putative ABC transport system substrate-binding protein
MAGMAGMARREFVALLSGSAAWPLVVRAQQTERIRRAGVLMNVAADDPLSTLRVSAFAQAMQEVGWSVGRNLGCLLIRCADNRS